MLNAKSGIAEMLQPAGGAGGARRQDSGGRESSGLFGDTLKGQMDKTAEGQKPAAREAEKPSRPEKKADSAPKSEQRTEPADAEEASAAPAAETTAAAETTEGEEVAADEAATPILTLVPQPVVDKPVTETPELDGAAQAETTESGNVLPPALPLVAAETQDAAQVEGGGEADGAELPRWMQALAATGRGREQAAAAQAASDEPSLSTEGEDGVQDGGFLKGWQAITAQLDSQRGDLGNRQGQGQGQGAEALFRLAGLAAQKDVAPPPMAMAASTVSSTAASAAPAPVQTLALDVPMRQSGWDTAFAERVVWMAKQGMQEAQISLNPRNMGPIEVHISMQKEQASVTFVAHHAATRDALEAAMPRLRDMLQDNGLNLAQSDVSHQSFEQRRDQAAGFSGDQGRGQHGRGDGQPADEGAPVETALNGSGLGAVDYYA
jgi:flagellar hook-length control protein FliK